MMEALRALASRPTTIIGIVTALLFQFVFTVIWMTGYNGMSDRTDTFVIGIVNEDPLTGSTIAAQLKEQLPVQVREMDNPAEAARQLENRSLQMVMRIPPDFSAAAASPDGAAPLQFTINESNPSMVKSMMSALAEQITASVNKQVIHTGARQMLIQMQQPEEQAEMTAGFLSERVTADISYINPVQGVHNQMVPLMIVLASYVGAMIMGMNLELSNMAAAAAGIGKWQRFGARMMFNMAAAVVISLVGVSLLFALGGQSASSFLALWGFEALVVLTFILVSQLFLLLFGMAGMALNIMMLAAQLVTSGAIMPRELLPEFYGLISRSFPATYAVEGAMNLLFGGPSVGPAILNLTVILTAALVLGTAATAIRKSSAQAVGIRADQPQVN